MFAAGNSLLAAAFFVQVHLCATSAVPVVASRGRAIQCSATAFDRQLKVVLAEAETIGATAALRAHLDDLDEEFIPMLGDLIDEANGIEAERLLAIMSAFDEIYPSPVTMFWIRTGVASTARLRTRRRRMWTSLRSPKAARGPRWTSARPHTAR
jgi:hypothetical protein